MEEEDFNDEKLDQKLDDLYAQIQDCQAQRVQLVTLIKSNKAKLNEANALVARLPKINQIIKLAEQLPEKEIESLAQRMKDLFDRVQDLASHDQNEKRSFEYDKASFVFD